MIAIGRARAADRFKLFDCGLIGIPACLCQQQVVVDIDHCIPACGLARSNIGGKQIMPYYVLNQFDYSLPLHLDVREILREQIGDRLLPFALRRSPAVSEALAEGMTVIDYAPGAVVAEDYAHLAQWVRSLSAPAAHSSQNYGSVRWSER